MAVSERDQRTHATVCQQPTAGQSWTDRCTCRHTRLHHADASHAVLSARRGVACSGRNSAGPCRDCPCPCFTAPAKAEEAAR